MKRSFYYSYVLMVLVPLLFCCNITKAQTNTTWNKKNADAWMKKAVWMDAVHEPVLHYDNFGRVLEDELVDSSAGKAANKSSIVLKPHSTINKIEFARQYNKDKVWWDEAFAYLKETDLTTLKAGKFSIDGDNVMVTVLDGTPRLMDTTKWESHLLYADIHYVISGKEKIGITNIAAVQQFGEYNKVRDLFFYTGNGKYYTAEPGTFYVFFPQDAHRPNLQIGDAKVKKIVIKIRRSNP